mmetsp:Transcript_821/g.3167  ORF Transcript_821/g.3167 Transcript_821/m.3167 type:complete len:412 (-) Transcript_821:822-2057(-)
MASSRVMSRGGVNRTVSSVPLARMFVSFFSLHAFTSMVSSRLDSPMIMPSYTSTFGPTNMLPRLSSCPRAYVVVTPEALEIIAPFRTLSSAPLYGPYPWKDRCMVPVPRVSLMNTLRNPISPREGHKNSNLVLPPSPAPCCISTRSPFLTESASITPPTCSSSTSAKTSSRGSSFLPGRSGSSLNSTAGGLTESSKFSLRMVSMSTPRCSSPLPCTSNRSPPPFSSCSTRNATFVSASATSLSQMFRPVRFFPSRPPSFESFTPNVIFKVGGSMGDAGSGSVTVTDATVSVTVARESPATETMSPAAADASGDRTPPCDVNSLVTRPVSRSPSPPSPIFIALTRSPTATRPLATLPVTSLPTNASCSIIDTSNLNSSSGSPGGGGTRSKRTSSNGATDLSALSPPHKRRAS